MISRRHSVWVWACVLLVAFGSAAGQTAPAAPEKPAVEPLQPEAGGEQAGQPPGGTDANKGKPDKGAGSGAGRQRGRSTSPFGGWFLPVMIGALLLMFLLSSRSRRKQEKKRQEMLAGLKKGAKVTTIGGIIGTVIEVREDEVTVKVDEQNNVRMRFVRRAIQGVGEQAKKEVGEEKR